MICILRTKILTETQSLCLYPCLLKLYENQVLRPVRFFNGCTEVYAEN